MNFHEAMASVRTQLYHCGTAVYLWKCLNAMDVPLLNRRHSFLRAAWESAWDAAIVRTVCLVDSRSDCVGLAQLVEMSEELDTRRGEPFIEVTQRAILQSEVRKLLKDGEKVRFLRHHQSAHNSARVNMIEVMDCAAAAREELVPFFESIMIVFRNIEKAAGMEQWELPDFETEINGDLEVIRLHYAEFRSVKFPIQ